jgi:predicted RNA-binding Zn-ribbon protein involved in translation (DUF1610 family)
MLNGANEAMVRTSTSQRHGYVCPECQDQLTRDRTGRGCVAHAHNPNCGFEKGERDDFRIWHEVDNNDNGSLITGDVKLAEGAVIRIRGEERTRTITYVMGSDRNGWRACMSGQGAMPTGRIAWQIVSFGQADEGSGGTDPPPPPGRCRRFFDFHTAKGVVEFIAALMAVIAGFAAFLGWMLGMFR